MEQMPPEVEELSEFGRTVFRQLVMGKQEKTIAEDLAASPHTIHGHVKAIYRCFRVSSRPELLSLMLRRQACEISELREQLNRHEGKPAVERV